MKKILFILLLFTFVFYSAYSQGPGPSKKCPTCGLAIGKCQYKGKHPKPQTEAKCKNCGKAVSKCEYRGKHPVETASYANNTLKVNGVEYKMIEVEGGTFQMGSNDSEAYNYEKPVHAVTLSDYYIGQTEVTQALWKAVMGRNPSYFKGDNLPVENVSWDDCQDFIKKLNVKTGRTFRLPTEAEWEYAARGGKKSKGYKYSGSNNLGDVAWYENNSGKKSHPVKTKSPNELGIYDMSGNVWEWCQDLYGSYSSGAVTNPTGATSGSDRVFRGGGWHYNAADCRSAARISSDPSIRLISVGFRLALSPSR